jgi:hypothetical protein
MEEKAIVTAVHAAATRRLGKGQLLETIACVGDRRGGSGGPEGFHPEDRKVLARREKVRFVPIFTIRDLSGLL